GEIADATRHPFRVQSEQFKLTRILCELLRGAAEFAIEFDAKLVAVAQDATNVRVGLERGGRREERCGRWLIGADGARSEVRRALGIDFAGFTWPERFLVVSTPYDFDSRIADLAAVSYVADPLRWYFLLQIPGLWRVMFPVAPHVGDDAA